MPTNVPLQATVWDQFAWLFSTGIEHQPGPDPIGTDPHELLDWDNDKVITIFSSNITCLETHAVDLARTKADLHVFQEHSADKATISRLAGIFLKNKRSLVAGPLDPNVKGHKLGGVAASAKREHRLIQIASRTKAFEDAVNNGRALHLGLGLKNGVVLAIFIIYGWSGSNGSKKNAAKTNLLIQAIHKERETQPSGPCLIMGDLNADPENIAATKDMLANGL